MRNTADSGKCRACRAFNSSGFQVGAEGLFDYHAAAFGKTGRGQSGDGWCEHEWGQSQVDQDGTAGSGDGSVQRLGIADIALNKAKPAHEFGPHRMRQIPGVALKALPSMVTKLCLVPVASAHAHDVQVGRKQLGLDQLGQRTQKVTPGEVTGGAEDDQTRRFHRSALSRAR